jgi:UDP-N-acetylglucosamine:LPS N-acetylglucosamine transferase
VAPRVLILTASIGEGHDAPTRTLSDQLRSECPDVDITVEDGLAVMGRAVRAMSESAPRVVFFRGEWLWDLGYTVFARIPVTRHLSQLTLAKLGSNGLLRLVTASDPDVVVSLYPHTTEVLGRLRRDGRLDVPVVAGVTDLAGLWYWATPGADVHLVTHPESLPEVRAIAGRHAEVHCVHGFTSPAFLEPPDRESARAALSLPERGRVALVSGGGWGVGRIGEALEVCLGIGEIDLVACLCGRNERLVDELARRYAGEPRIRIEGFTNDMPDWLAAVDVLIHSTGGLTVLEAQMSGCPAVSFGWGRGHVRAHNEAFRRFGLAQVADSAAELEAAVEQALRNPGVIPFDFSRLPSAASIVLAQAGAREGRIEASA